MSEDRPLTTKQELFVEEYLVDLNATGAAERAGYSDPNYGRQLITLPNVAAAIAHAQARRSARTEITADEVLREFARMGLYDPADIASQRMSGPEDIAKLPEPVRRAIVGWGWDKHGNFTLKLANKQAALDSLGKHLGLYVERHEHTGRDGGPIQTEDVTELSDDDLRKRASQLANRLAVTGPHTNGNGNGSHS